MVHPSVCCNETLRPAAVSPREMFEGMDANASGALSAAELTSGLRQQGYEVSPKP